MANIFSKIFSGKKAIKESAAGPMIAYNKVGKPITTPDQYDKLMKESYQRNVIAYRCVSMIANCAANVPIELYDGQGNEINGGEVYELVKRPNPLQSMPSFLEACYSYLLLTGNTYIEGAGPDKNSPPLELYSLRPDRMKIIPSGNSFPAAFEYSASGQKVKWPADPITGFSKILHMKRFSPLDDYYGQSALRSAFMAIDQHNQAGEWNLSMLQNGMRPTGALMYSPKEGPQTLSDEQFRKLKDELENTYSGSNNSGRPLLLEGGLEWREMSINPKDMDWLQAKHATATEIAQSFGVPAQLVGIPDSQTYANMQEARLALYEETILPMVHHFNKELSRWLSQQFGQDVVIMCDEDKISALSYKRDLLWAKLQNATFLTVNEKRQALGYEPIEGGDALLVPAGQLPISDAGMPLDIPEQSAADLSKMAYGK